MDIFESAAHAVLAADRAQPQPHLRIYRSEQRAGGDAPYLGIGGHPFKKFLQGQTDIRIIGARRNDLGNGCHNRIDRPDKRARFHEIGRVAVSRNRAHVRFAAADLRGHGNRGGKLIFPAPGHIHRARADRRVEGFRKPLLRTDVEIGEHFLRFLGKVRFLFVEPTGDLIADFRVRRLLYAVGIEKFAGNIHDRPTLEQHFHTARIRDCRDGRGGEIFLGGQSDKRFRVLLVHNHRHALLRFGNGELGARQALVFLGHFIEVDGQSVGEFADRHGDAARAEIVAFFDFARNFGVHEQPLKLSFRQGIALLHLRAARFHRTGVVRLGGARRTAAPVAARFTAQQQNDIPRRGRFAADHIPLCAAHDEARFEAFRLIALVIYFIDDSRRQADLIAVGGEARRRPLGNRALGQLARKRILQLLAGIGGARHPHRLIDVRSAAQRIADRAAQTGRRAAERLDFRRVIVRFVLEHYQPILRLAVHVHSDLDRASVDFVRLVEVIEVSLSFQLFRRNRRHVHEAGVLAATSLVKPLENLAVTGERRADTRIVGFYRYFIQAREESGVTAVVGPICIDDLDFRQRGIALFRPEIVAHELKVGVGHREPEAVVKLLQFLVGQVDYTQLDAHFRLFGRGAFQRFGHRRVALPAVHGVYKVLLYFRKVVRRHAVKDVNRGAPDNRAHAAGEKLHALRRRVRALVVLPVKVLRNQRFTAGKIGGFVNLVHHRLGENRGHGALEVGFFQPLDVVAYQLSEPVDFYAE